MLDFSKLSDDELMKMAQGGGPAMRIDSNIQSPSSGPDFSKLSDAELEKMAAPPLGFFDRIKKNWSDATDESNPQLKALKETQAARSQDEIDHAAGAGGVLHGATLGYEPQIIGGAQTAYNKLAGNDDAPDYVHLRDAVIKKQSQLKEESPWSYGTGTVVGGALPALVTGGGAAPSSLMGAIKTGAATGAAFGAAANPGDTEGKIDTSGQFGDRLVNAAIGAPLGGVLGAGANGLSKAAESIGGAIKTTPKANADEIAAASKSLGIEPTPGMMVDGHFVGNLESSLDQSPSIAGRLVRDKTDQVRRGLRGATDKVFEDASSGLSPFESGENAKGQILAKVGEKHGPLSMSYDDIAESTKNAAVSPNSIDAVSRNIKNLDDARLAPGSPWAQKADQYADWLQNAKSVDDISKLRTLVRKDSEAATGPEKQVLSAIYDKMSDMRQAALLQAAKQSASTPRAGEAVGRDLVDQLKQTDAGYRDLMTGLRSFSDNAKLGRVEGPQGFTSSIEGLKSEQVPDRLFNMGDTRLRQSLKDQFPDAAETLRQAKLAQFQKQSQGIDGNASPVKMSSAMDKLGPETRTDLLGANSEIPGQVSTVVHSLPPNVNPSKTSMGESFKDSVNPLFQAKEMGRYGAYKLATNGGANNLSSFLMQSPRFSQMAQKNPGAFNMLLQSMGGRTGQQNQTPVEPTTDMHIGSSQTPVNPETAKKQFVDNN